MEELTCQRCGHKWPKRVEKPMACPRCKSYEWDEKRPNKEGATNGSV